MKKNNKVEDYLQDPNFQDHYTFCCSLITDLIRYRGWQANLERDKQTAFDLYILWKREFPLLLMEDIERILRSAVLNQEVEKLCNAAWFKPLNVRHRQLKEDKQRKEKPKTSQKQILKEDFEILEGLMEEIQNVKDGIQPACVDKEGSLLKFCKKYKLLRPDALAKAESLLGNESSGVQQNLGRTRQHNQPKVTSYKISPVQDFCFRWWLEHIAFTKKVFCKVHAQMEIWFQEMP